MFVNKISSQSSDSHQLMSTSSSTQGALTSASPSPASHSLLFLLHSKPVRDVPTFLLEFLFRCCHLHFLGECRILPDFFLHPLCFVTFDSNGTKPCFDYSSDPAPVHLTKRFPGCCSHSSQHSVFFIHDKVSTHIVARDTFGH